MLRRILELLYRILERYFGRKRPVTILRVSDFGGMIPKLDDKTLPANCAVEAINCDLRGRGIRPVYATLEKIASVGAATSAVAASQYGYRVTQIQTAVAKMVGGAGSAAYAYPDSVPSDVLGANYVVAATDDLWYAVFLPNGTPSQAGVGCIDIEFSDGATLNHASVVDQNALSAVLADITPYAEGKWYIRKIALGGKTASDAAAITGKTIKRLRLYQNHTNAALLPAYYAFAIIRDRNAVYNHKKYLLGPEDPAEAFTLSATGGGRSVSWAVIDEDEVLTQNYPVLVTSLAGAYRTKLLASLDQSMISGYQRNVASLAGHDAICSAGASASGVHFTFEDDSQDGPDGHKTVGHSGTYRANAYGWVGIQGPAAAPAAGVVGGTGPSVTRAYVYTFVSEDGLESAPSPAGSATGNEDGSWSITPVSPWTGTDQFRISSPAGSLLHKRRLYRTSQTTGKYLYVGEMDDNDVVFVDAVAEASLGEECPTLTYQEMPPMTGLSAYQNGMLAGVLDGGAVCFSESYQPHAWPLAYRYTLPMSVSWTYSVGDRVVALGNGKPIGFSGQTPDSLVWSEYYAGEACLGHKGVAQSRFGLIYPGTTAWGMIDSGGYRALTDGYFTAEQYASLVSAETVAMFDGRKLFWITRGETIGYSLELGAEERALTKFEVPYAIYGMGYYAQRNSRWVSYWDGVSAMKMGKLFGDTTQKLKWTWKSKPLRTAKPVSLMVAQVESDEWDSLSNSMKYRDGFRESIPAWATGTAYEVGNFVTEGGNTYRCDIAHTAGTFAADLAALKWVLTNAAYTIAITGLTQAEKWCYLKVWADADKSAEKVLVYDDFVPSDRPVVLDGGILSDCWQFELQANMKITGIALAETERELREE